MYRVKCWYLHCHIRFFPQNKNGFGFGQARTSWLLEFSHWTSPSKETLDKSFKRNIGQFLWKENIFVFMEQLLLYQFLFACNYVANWCILLKICGLNSLPGNVLKKFLLPNNILSHGYCRTFAKIYLQESGIH